MPSSHKPNRYAARLRATRGITLKAFALKHGFAARTVQAALKGDRNGPKSQTILKTLTDELRRR